MIIIEPRTKPDPYHYFISLAKNKMSDLNVETAAAVSAFVQNLHNAAQGGHVVDEETLALRMLAQVNTDPDFDSSHITSFSTNDNSRVVMDTGEPQNEFAAFKDLMMGDLKDPAEQIDMGMVPKPPPVVIEDPVGAGTQGYDQNAALKNYGYLKDAQSVCQMFTNIMLMTTNPGGFDITKDAAAAFNIQAKLAYNAMAGPMAGVYNFSQGEHTTHNFGNLPQSEVHEKLLETMFDNMQLDEDHKKEIDSKITNFVKALNKIEVGGKHSTLDFALRFGLTPAINITASKAQPVWAFSPTTYLIYLKMDAHAYKQSISKNNSQNQVNLKYEHVITKFELNVDHFLKLRPKYDAMFKKATNLSLKEYSDKLSKPVKKAK